MRVCAHVLVVIAALLVGCAQESSQTAAEPVKWEDNYHLGIEKARKTGKAVMLFFTADWCPPCNELKKYVFTEPRVAAASRELINIAIDVDDNRQLMRDYKVRSIPAIFFFLPRNQNLLKFTGPRTVDNFLKHMRTAAADSLQAGDQTGD